MQPEVPARPHTRCPHVSQLATYRRSEERCCFLAPVVPKATWKPATSTTCVPNSLWLRNRIQYHNYRMIKNLPLVSATQHNPKQCAEARDIPRHYHRNQSDYSKKRLGPAFGSTGPPFQRPLCAICCLCACSFSSGCLRWLHGCCQTCPHDRRRHPPPFAVKPFFFVWCTCSRVLLPSPDIVHAACSAG